MSENDGIWNKISCKILGHSKYLIQDKPEELPTCGCCLAPVEKYENYDVLQLWKLN